MATVMLMHWPEVSKAQYERVRKEVHWEGAARAGAKFHVAWFGADGFRVLDLWESRQDFEQFTAQRLMPAIQRIGVQGQPAIEFEDVQTMFVPKVGNSSE